LPNSADSNPFYMKTAFKILPLFALVASSLSAAEVYFDTVNTASAERLHGAYFGAFAGGVDLNGSATSSRLNGVNVSGRSRGEMGGIEFGYKWATPVGINLAAELEMFYLSQYLDGSGRGGSYRSKVKYGGAMANGVIQLDLGAILGDEAGWVGRIKPYIGGGVGYGYGAQDFIQVKYPGTNKTRRLNDGGETAFSSQLFAGVEVEVMENFSVYGEYRQINFYDFGNSDLRALDFGSWLVGVRFQY
jgi:opacity protein-like surface antigen